MSISRIFIFEFVSGGGFNKVDIPVSLFCEAYSMLRAIIKDFKAMGYEISTLLDYRISYLKRFLKVDNIKYVKAKDDYINIFKKKLVDCEAAFIIAPEFSNILYDLTKIVKTQKKQILSIDLKGIQLGTSKFRTYLYFKKNYIRTPETYQIILENGLYENFIIKKLNELKPPIIIKPDDGVGAESILCFQNDSQIHDFFKNSKDSINFNRKYILQKYILGDNLSASIIGLSHNSKQNSTLPLILSVNSQDVKINNLKNESEYLGGDTPVQDYIQINKLLSRILKKLDLSMFKSYFGIDFIKNGDIIDFIEINPRLTTSYIGISNIININPVEIITDNSSNNPKLKSLEIKNHSIFKRLDLKYTGSLDSNEIKEQILPKMLKRIPELITPPISFNNSNQTNQFNYSCFIATKEKSISYSKNRLNKIIDILHTDYKFEISK